jgi:predicted dehydrogenase/NADPH:quinone reductase-like Zn-dependent oxidoreductase
MKAGRQMDRSTPSGPTKAAANRIVGTLLGRVGHSEAMAQDAKREAWWWLQARAAAVAHRRPLLAGTAVVWTSRSRVEALAFELPAPGDGEVTVALDTTVVSLGTERARLLGLPGASINFPFRPGNSGAGRVVAVGRGVSGLRLADRVATTGTPHASVATVPAAAALPIADGVSITDAALVQLAVISGWGLRLAGITPGDELCVIGAGPIGALAQRLATTRRPGPITVVARSRLREEVARRGGACRFLLAQAEREAIARVGANVVIEATGDPDAVNLAVAAAGPGARVVLLGSPRGVTTTVDVETIRDKGLRIIGAHVATLAQESERTGLDASRREAEAFLAALGDGLHVSDLVDTVVDPREAALFYRDVTDGRAMVGARFDWTALAPRERARRASFARLPDLSGRGITFSRPLPAPRGGRAKSETFAGAVGRMRIGLLGCGEIGAINAAAIARVPNAELVACHDPVERLAADVASRHDADTVTTVDDVLARSDVDAVVLAVPHHLHAPLAIRAAEAGKHVMVEKPMATDLDAAVTMAKAAERAGIALSVCFPNRFQAAPAIAASLIRQGALGEFEGALVKLLADKPPSYWRGGYSGRSPSEWRMRRDHSGGGVLIMNLCHYVDLLRWLTGEEIEEIFAVAAAPGADVVEVEEAISLSANFDNGALATLVGASATRGFGAPASEMLLWGRDGTVAIEPRPQVFTLRALDGVAQGRWQALNPPTVDHRAVYVSRFVSAVSREEPPEVTAADGLAVQALIEAAYRSVTDGRPRRPADLLKEALA